MKTIPNSPILKAWLARNEKYAELAKREVFSFEDELFAKASHIVAAHHPQMNQASVEIRAALQLLMGGHPGEAAEPDAAEPEGDPEQEMVVDSLEVRLPSWVKKWAILVAILLTIIAFAAIAKAEPEPGNTIPQGQVLAALHSNPGALAIFGGVVIQLQNGGSTLATRGGGLVIFNCTGSGLSCSFSGSTFTMNGSGGGGTGCTLQGGTNLLLYDTSTACNDITKWSTNGTTTITGAATAILDLSAAATFKVPTSGGCAPTVNAVACYDSTNHLWVFGSNGATVTLCPGLTGGTAGQVFESNGGTSCGGYADPIVSGPDAPGAVPTKNPVQIGSFDGTDVQRVSSDTSGRLNVNINGTAAISAASLPLPTGAATSANQCGTSTPCEVSATSSANSATNPLFDRPTDGTNPMGLMTTYGSTPSGFALPVNAFVTNFPATQAVSWSGQSVSLTGSWPYSGALGTVSLTGTLPAFGSTPTFNCGIGCFQTTQPISAAVGALADGADTTQGTTLDAEVIGNNTGTQAGKLRGIDDLINQLEQDTRQSNVYWFNYLTAQGIDPGTGQSFGQLGLGIPSSVNPPSVIEAASANPANGMLSNVPGAGAMTNSLYVIKTSPGQLTGWNLGNPNASTMEFVLCYDASSTTQITVGTTTPKFVFTLPGGGAANLLNTVGKSFNSGLICTASSSVSSSSAPATGLVVELDYE